MRAGQPGKGAYFPMAGTNSRTVIPCACNGSICCRTRNRVEGTDRPDVNATTCSVSDKIPRSWPMRFVAAPLPLRFSRPDGHTPDLTERPHHRSKREQRIVLVTGLLRKLSQRSCYSRRPTALQEPIPKTCDRIAQDPLIEYPFHLPTGLIEQFAQGLRGEVIEMTRQVDRVPGVFE